MIVKCPECELPVSDKALSCPHCGYPLQTAVKRPKPRSRMRLPNGFGQISEIKSKPLRKPFRAMVTVGKNANGRPICKVLSYHKTYNEAYAALMEYNKNPYDLDNDITIEELYSKWSIEYFNRLSNESSARIVKAAWKQCDSVKNIKVKDFRARHIKQLIEPIDRQGVKVRVKSMFNMMLDYAVEYDIVDRNYARTFNVKQPDPETEHISFTDDEMEILWNHQDDPIVQLMLIQCYTGFRPKELCELKAENITTEYLTGGMKTKAGKNRTVPIHRKIKGLVVNALPTNLDYFRYYSEFKKVISKLNLNIAHRPHDPRKHFITMAKRYQVDEYAIKYIVGHAISDITERVYTERTIDWLANEINKIE